VFLPNDLLVHKGEPGKEMFFIAKGRSYTSRAVFIKTYLQDDSTHLPLV
jgi:hypothetical protein